MKQEQMQMQRQKQPRSWWILLIVSFGVMIPFAAPYLTFNPASSRVDVSSDLQFAALTAHIVTAFAALAAGFLQFAGRIRTQRPKLHRYAGRVYVASVWISGMLALLLLFGIEDFARALSFLTLSVLWLYTSWKGYRAAVFREWEEHRLWMIRSFGITLVAVCARLLVPVLLFSYAVLNEFSLPGGRERMVEEVLNVNVWAGLVTELLIVEWIVVRRMRKRPAA